MRFVPPSSTPAFGSLLPFALLLIAACDGAVGPKDMERTILNPAIVSNPVSAPLGRQASILLNGSAVEDMAYVSLPPGTIPDGTRADGREVVFWSGPGRGGLGGADIWSATRPSVHHAWGAPAPLGGPVNTSTADLESGLSFDGRTLVFSSGQPRGGVGKSDLWIATRTPAGK